MPPAWATSATTSPTTTPAWAGADSLELLRTVVVAAHDAGWTPVNADCTVVLDVPKLAPHRALMIERLSAALGAPVNVKATRPEGITDGVLCLAVVLLEAR